MVEDVVPGLLKQIKTDFERGQLSSSTIKGLLDKLCLLYTSPSPRD